MLITTSDLILCRRRFLRLLMRAVMKNACFQFLSRIGVWRLKVVLSNAQPHSWIIALVRLLRPSRSYQERQDLCKAEHREAKFSLASLLCTGCDMQFVFHQESGQPSIVSADLYLNANIKNSYNKASHKRLHLFFCLCNFFICHQHLCADSSFRLGKSQLFVSLSIHLEHGLKWQMLADL